jgi:rubrerythrin
MRKNPITETEYTEMLERAFHDEAEGTEFYQHFLNMLPNTDNFRDVRATIDTILYDEKMHLAELAKLIDNLDS